VEDIVLEFRLQPARVKVAGQVRSQSFKSGKEITQANGFHDGQPAQAKA
jgi:hypothetical protein